MTGLRNNRWMKQVSDRVCPGRPSRRKIAIAAVARLAGAFFLSAWLGAMGSVYARRYARANPRRSDEVPHALGIFSPGREFHSRAYIDTDRSDLVDC